MQKPVLHGVYWCHRNRFSHDFDQNPSPQRSDLYPILTEHLPVICDYCGQPFWPAAEVMRGYCSELCQQHEHADMQVMEQLQAEAHAAAIETELAAIRLGQGVR